MHNLAAPTPPEGESALALRAHLLDIIGRRSLTALLQPIVHMAGAEIIGYEGLIRGPSDSALHAPLPLFSVARANALTLELEDLCRQVVLERFAELGLSGKLFLNVSPECLLHRGERNGQTVALMRHLGINPERVVIELTENEPTYDYALMREALLYYRALGFQIAIDDLGEGFSSLRLWSELRPEYVKIDMHFAQGINRDPVKLQFVRSIQEIAEKSNSLVIAEGIETQAELLVLRDLGVRYGQGYHLGRPQNSPDTALPAEVRKALARSGVAVYPHPASLEKNVARVGKLLLKVSAVSPAMSNNDAYELFVKEPRLLIMPIIDQGVPLGLLSRFKMIEQFARPFQRELHGKKSCTLFMDPKPMIVDQDTSLEDLSYSMAQADAHHLSNGFIITGEGCYLGMGTGHDLMREITQMQIHAARYANPLTGLPGNVPINEHIDRLIASGTGFQVCYCDLDNFKPFNDVYGYRKGDDVIALAASLISAQCDPNRDFVGHIGGDDFIVVFQSEDWEARCAAMLEQFERAIEVFFSTEDRDRGGYLCEDRQGKKVFYCLISLSLGVIRVRPQQYYSHYQIASAAADAKKQAKKLYGNSLFIDRRDAAI